MAPVNVITAFAPQSGNAWLFYRRACNVCSEIRVDTIPLTCKYRIVITGKSRPGK